MATAEIACPRLSLHGLSLHYEKHAVLKGLDFAIAAGETVALIGRSGCGKTSLLKSASLFALPSSGEAFLDGQCYLSQGQPIFEPWEVRRQVIMVWQEHNLFPNLTGLQNITFPLQRVSGLSLREASERAFKLATRLGVEAALNRYPISFSGGESQRIALLRAIVLEPKVLLLDEITSALDPATILDVIDALRHLRDTSAQPDMAIVLVTHLFSFAEEFADRVVFLHEGQAWEDMPARGFMHCAKLPETQAFISKTRMPF